MEEGFQITPGKLYGFQGSGDTSNQMFGLMDDVAGTFQSEFESAKARQNGEAKGSTEEAEETEESAAVEGEAADTEESSVKDGTEEVIADAPIEEETPLLTEEASVEVEEVAEAPVEVPAVEVEELSDSEEPVVETAAVEEEVAVVEEEEVAVEEQGVPVQESAEAEAAVISTPEEVTTEPPEELVEQEPIAAPVATEAEAKVDVEEAVAEPEGAEVPDEAVATVERPVTEPVASEETAEESVALPKAVKRNVIPKPQALPKATGEEPIVEAPRERTESAPAPENFHSIIAEEDEAPRVIRLDSDEARRILAGVQDVAAKSQIQNPVANKVSPRLLEGLKANNAQLARQIEAARAPGTLTPQSGVATKPMETKSSSSPRRADRPYENPRMEQLKQKVMEQVKFQMRMAMRNNAGEIQMKLKPHMLGNVKVSLLVEQSQVTASFIVENQSTRDLLQRSSSQLHDMLAEQGLEVDQVDVALDDRSGDSGHGKAFASVEEQQAAREYLASFGSLIGGEGEEVAESAGSDDAADPDQILNIVA